MSDFTPRSPESTKLSPTMRKVLTALTEIEPSKSLYHITLCDLYKVASHPFIGPCFYVNKSTVEALRQRGLLTAFITPKNDDGYTFSDISYRGICLIDPENEGGAR